MRQPFPVHAMKTLVFIDHCAGLVPAVAGWFSTLHTFRKGERSPWSGFRGIRWSFDFPL